jgi:hypothetical protein
VQKKFPGNIGEGISRDADVKSKKKAIRIANPFMGYLSSFVFYVLVLIGLSRKISNIAIFNKHYCLNEQQKYNKPFSL